MDFATIVKIGQEAASAINKALDKIPDADQRKLDDFFKFYDGFTQESNRIDSDHDTMMLYKERKEILTDTVLRGIYEKRKK